MAKYGGIERKIAGLLEKYPFIKKNIKITYQYLNYIIYKKKKNNYLNEKVTIKKIGVNGSFWGYYDKSPSVNGGYIYNSFEKSNRYDVRKNQNLDIYLDNNKISETNTWNWQQGCMLTWLDENRFIHNFFDGSYKSKIINIDTRDEKIIDFPIYSVSKTGDFAISLNFSRLAKLRPDYGYFNRDLNKINKLDKNDGVYFIDLEKNETKLIITFEELLKFNYREEMKDAWHKVNHLEISPDSKRFIFHHRWFDDNGRKWSRLISVNVDGSDIYILSDDNMVSHCIWKNSSEIVGWMRKNGIGDRYFLLKDKSKEYSVIGDGLLIEDGHPSFSKDGKWMLTDTYPDKSRMSNLILFNLESNEIIKLGQFFSSFEYYGENRCDLHPRFNSDNLKITFDSVHTGVRELYEMDISKIIKGE